MSTPGRHAPLQSNKSLSSSGRKSPQGMHASGDVRLCTPQQSCLRVQRLQHLCAVHGLDAIIIVLGIDGRYNLGSHQLAGYLINGCCGRGILDSVRLPEDIEDNFIVIRPDQVFVYSNTPAVTQLCAILRPCCSKLTVVVPTEAQCEDADELEELKVAAFVQALVGVHRIGVSLAPEVEQCEPQNIDVHIIEEWPLIQAYGLEGVGRPGFFSTNFQVSNVYSQLQDTYAKLDGWSLRDLLTISIPTLTQHCVEFKRNMMQKLPRSKGEATERQLAEPLLSYYAYGTLRRTVGVGQASVMQPRVVSGSRTNKASEMTADIRLCDPDPCTGQAPVHLVMEAADPHSPIRLARTHFLTCGQELTDIFSDEDELYDQNMPLNWDVDCDRHHDARTLARLYAQLVRFTLLAIRHFALQEGATVQSTRAVIVDQLVSSTSSSSQPLTRADVEQRLVFSLWSCDHANNVTSVAERGSLQLKVAHAALKDIRSSAPGHAGKLLGSVVYGDTFIEVPAGCGQGPSLLNLTQSIPVMVTTVCTGDESGARLRSLKSFSSKLQQLLQARQQPGLDGTMRINRSLPAPSSLDANVTSPNGKDTVAKLVTSLGALLSVGGGDETTVLTGSPAACAYSGMVYFFSYGLVFLPRMSPTLVFDFRYDAAAVIMQELRCPDSGLPPLGEALVIRCKTPSAGWAPACHLSDNVHLALPFASYSQGLRRNLLSAVVPAWQQACREAGVSWIRDPTAPHPFPPYMYACQWFEVHKSSKQYAVVTPDDNVEEMLQRLDNIELLENGWCSPAVERMLLGDAASPISQPLKSQSMQPSSPSPMSDACSTPITAPMQMNGSSPGPDLFSFTRREGWVTLVTGLPGATQLLVSSVVASVSSAQGEEPKVLVLPARGAPWLDQEELNKELEPLLQPTISSKVPHVVLAISCYDDLPQQLTVLASCPSIALGRVGLRTCITCITTHGFFDGDTRQQPLPGGLDQVVPGLVDAVVLSGLNPSAVQQLVQLRNEDVPLLRATWSQLMASRAHLLPDLAERATRLASPDARLARHWIFPTPGQQLRLLSGPLQSSFAACTGGQLDLNTFKSLLQELGLEKEASSKQPAKIPVLEAPTPDQQPYAVFAYALVRHAEADGVQEVVAWRHVGAIVRNRESNADAQLVNLPDLLHAGSGPGAQLVVYGTALPPGLAVRLLCEAQHSTALPAPPTRRTLASITPEEQEFVRRRHLWDPLPEGWYCSGSMYVDEFGCSSETHPCMDTFVEQYLAEQQAQAVAEHAQKAAEANGFPPVVFTDNAWWTAE